MERNQLSGLVLLCDENGIIDKVVRDDYAISGQDLKGKLVTQLFEKEFTPKVLDFLINVKKRRFVFDFPMTISAGEKSIYLSFTGFFLENNVWMVGTESPSSMLQFINQLQQINNEQANFIRMLAKNNYSEKKNASQTDEHLFDELSRLNNELVNLQREMAKKNAELARLNELKNQFLGMAAHDVRNPLGVIMNFSEFLIDETENTFSEEHKKFLKIIYSSAEFLLKLIEDLLDISKIESGKLNLNLQKADFVEFAERNIQLNNILASKKNITIQLNYDQKPVVFNFDQQKMEQVFNNLLTNAVKFSYEGNNVMVTIRANEGSVWVEVQDQGIGIPSHLTETIFHPFSKASTAGTAGEKSTGLGLTIVKRIIEGHGGSIAVKSEEGKGSVFFFELPVHRDNVRDD
jgi:signal transduction histidine kinase